MILENTACIAGTNLNELKGCSSINCTSSIYTQSQ